MVTENKVFQLSHVSLHVTDHKEEQFELIDAWLGFRQNLLDSNYSYTLNKCYVAKYPQ